MRKSGVALLLLLLLLSVSVVWLIRDYGGTDVRQHRRPSTRNSTAALLRTVLELRDAIVSIIRSSDSMRPQVGAPTWPPPSVIDGMRDFRKQMRSTQFPNGIASRAFPYVIHHHHQPSAAEMVERVQEDEVVYFIKACKKYNERARRMYDSWARSARRVYFSTDRLLDGIPREKQIVTDLQEERIKAHVLRSGKWGFSGMAASCFLTTINTGRLLSAELFPAETKWLVFLDDDTFVVRRNLREYLSAFPSAGGWYLGLSNAEMPGVPAGDTNKTLAITATAPGVAFSRGGLDAMRRGGASGGADLSDLAVAADVCRRTMHKDDVALGYVALVSLRLTYVARPDLRGYHFKSMKDPAHLKPLTIHTELQDFPKDLGHIFQDLQNKYLGNETETEES